MPFDVQSVRQSCARTHIRPFYVQLYVGPVHTNAFWKVCVFIIIENESINSSPHYCFDAFSTVHTKSFENDRARCTLWCKLNSMRMPQTQAPAIFSVIAFIFMPFRPSTLLRYVWVFVLILFQERFQIDAFSMKTLGVLLWMKGLNSSKCMSFQTKTH